MLETGELETRFVLCNMRKFASDFYICFDVFDNIVSDQTVCWWYVALFDIFSDKYYPEKQTIEVYGQLKFNFGLLGFCHAQTKMCIGLSDKFWDDVSSHYLPGIAIFEKERCTTL